MKSLKLFSITFVLFFSLLQLASAQSSPTPAGTPKAKNGVKAKKPATGSNASKSTIAAKKRKSTKADNSTASASATKTQKKTRTKKAKGLTDETAATSAPKTKSTHKKAPTVETTATGHSVASTAKDKGLTTKKANNIAKTSPTPSRADAVTKKTVSKPTASVAHATAGADKSIGKDAKNRTIYQGPRGGTYYINANGNKEYVTPDKN